MSVSNLKPISNTLYFWLFACEVTDWTILKLLDFTLIDAWQTLTSKFEAFQLRAHSALVWIFILADSGICLQDIWNKIHHVIAALRVDSGCAPTPLCDDTRDKTPHTFFFACKHPLHSRIDSYKWVSDKI